MSDKNKTYWFHAKSYGWGWGLPSAWQGWLSLAAFIIMISGLPFVIDPNENMLLFIAAMVIVSGILIGICFAKGEPPSWRWGASKNEKK